MKTGVIIGHIYANTMIKKHKIVKKCMFFKKLEIG